MNIKEQLQIENSKKNAMLIVDYIGVDELKFSILMDLFFSDGKRITQRAAWVMSLTAEKKVELLKPYLGKMINLLSKDIEVAVLRNMLRVIYLVDLPEDLLGITFDNCFKLTLSTESPIAIKSFCLGILKNICLKVPELKNEVLDLVDLISPNASSGLKNRCYHVRKILKKL